MSKKATTEVQSEPCVYIGPTILQGVLRKNTTVTEIPEKELEETFKEKPLLRECFIRMSEYPVVKAQLKDPNSRISTILKEVM